MQLIKCNKVTIGLTRPNEYWLHIAIICIKNYCANWIRTAYVDYYTKCIMQFNVKIKAIFWPISMLCTKLTSIYHFHSACMLGPLCIANLAGKAFSQRIKCFRGPITSFSFRLIQFDIHFLHLKLLCLKLLYDIGHSVPSDQTKRSKFQFSEIN